MLDFADVSGKRFIRTSLMGTVQVREENAAAALEVSIDRKSTRLNSSHTVIYTLSLHDALPIYARLRGCLGQALHSDFAHGHGSGEGGERGRRAGSEHRSEEHTSELQSHRDLHSFPTRRSSDLCSTSRMSRASASFGLRSWARFR